MVKEQVWGWFCKYPKKPFTFNFLYSKTESEDFAQLEKILRELLAEGKVRIRHRAEYVDGSMESFEDPLEIPNYIDGDVGPIWLDKITTIWFKDEKNDGRNT